MSRWASEPAVPCWPSRRPRPPPVPGAPAERPRADRLPDSCPGSEPALPRWPSCGPRLPPVPRAPAELPFADGLPDPCPGGPQSLLSRAGPLPSGLSSVGQWLLRFLFLVSSARWLHACLSHCSLAAPRLCGEESVSLWWLLSQLEGKSGKTAPLVARTPGWGHLDVAHSIYPLFGPLGCSPVTCPPPLTAPVCHALRRGGPNDPRGPFFFLSYLFIWLHWVLATAHEIFS